MKNHKSNLLLQLLKLLGAFIISYILVVVIFAAFTTGDEIPQSLNGIMTLSALIIAFAAMLIIDYNSVSHLKSRIEKSKADIDSVNETAKALIDKAERVADKYRADEIDVFKEFASARKDSKRIRTSGDFKAVMEAYPELKANTHIQRLLNQIESTENARLNAKLSYTEAVAEYNAKIHSFPVVLLRRLCKWEDADSELAIQKDEIVSDEELGI